MTARVPSISPPTPLHLLPPVTLSGTKNKNRQTAFDRFKHRTVIFYKDYNRIKFVQAQKTYTSVLHNVLSPWREGNKSLPPFFFHMLFWFGSLSLCLLVSLLYLDGDHQSNRLYYYFSSECFDFQPTQKINPPTNPSLLFSSFIPLTSLSSPPCSHTHPASFITSQCGLSDLNILHFFYVFFFFSRGKCLQVVRGPHCRQSVQHLDSSAMKPCCL